MLFQNKLDNYNLEEEERRNARNNLDTFLSEHMKPPGGVLQNIDSRRTKELSDLRQWNDGTKEQYEHLLAHWTKEVQKLKNKNLIKVEQEHEYELADDCHFTVSICNIMFSQKTKQKRRIYDVLPK